MFSLMRFFMKIQKLLPALLGLLCLSLNDTYAADTDASVVAVTTFTVRMAPLREVLAWQNQIRPALSQFSLEGQENQHYPIRRLNSGKFLGPLTTSLSNHTIAYGFHQDFWTVLEEVNAPDTFDTVNGTLYLVSVPNVENKEQYRGGGKLPMDVFWAQFGYVAPLSEGTKTALTEGTQPCNLFWVKFQRDSSTPS